MTLMTRPLMIGCAAAIVAFLALAVSPGEAAEVKTEDATVAASQLRVHPGHLLRHDGAELYQELCASCHGVAGVGNGPAARHLAVPTPALTHLKQAGVPRQHWTYVIWAGCEDHHHWAPDGSETMPCWRRIFRHALGDEAAPLIVSTKLVDYLASIQQ